jgi:serine phosphatase RsbU (regulator of sigma subunit)
MKKVMESKQFSKSYTKNIYRIIFIASISISFAVIITGILGYNNTKKSIISKEKSQDLVFIVKSMANKIDGRLNRALETSYIFANDPSNVNWVEGEEKNKELGNLVLKRVDSIASDYDYSNFFIVGIKTRHDYFAEKSDNKKSENNTTILSESNAADKWFFDWQKEKKQVDFNVNYDRVMDNTFLFINTRMGSADNPVGICGVGLSLSDIVKQFSQCKVGQNSNLWMIDDKGIIKLSDNRSNVGTNYNKFLPKSVISTIKSQPSKDTDNITVAQYVNSKNEIVDYAYCKLSSCNWTLFYQIPRSESVSIISSLKTNMILTVIIVLLCFIVLFYFASKKIANPYKQAMLMNAELENEVDVRTLELKESNEKIIDSIQYAKRLQESILPSQGEMKKIFKDNFVIWRPRDIVGGDFFWLRKIEDVVVFAVGDCTGHGVPGALMTMTVNAILHNIVTTINKEDPSLILKELHIRLKEALNKDLNSDSVDDGLDIAIFCIKDKVKLLLYAGANISLYIKNKEGVKTLQPQCRGVGYSYININESFESESIQIEEDDIFIVTTDGFLHQNGGDKNYPFGKKRFYSMLEQSEAKDLSFMKEECETKLEQYMKDKEQRDDITIVGFKIK